MMHVSEDGPFVFTIEEQTCTLSTASEPVITVKIGEISKDVLIDSGSASNLISQDNFKELIQRGLKAELQPCSKKLYGYGGQELEVVGQFKSELSVNGVNRHSLLLLKKDGAY